MIEATDAEVLNAIDGLKSMSLVFEGASSRVTRYEHNMARVLAVPVANDAVLHDLDRPDEYTRFRPDA